MILFSSPLLRWYHKNKRAMPWRDTRDPYRILVSEIMLQQTQVQTVIPYYHRFLKAFPTFHALANAPLDRVLKQWEGLGYYSRARNLHALAKDVVKNHRGQLPRRYDEVLALPGIGRYTAGAVLSIAFDQHFPVLDGNVQRVLTRCSLIEENVKDSATQKKLWALATQLLPKKETGNYNQALMELGATVCTPRAPSCSQCPLRRGCKALKAGRQEEFPVKDKAKAVPQFKIGAGIIWNGNKILIGQRPLKGLLGGLWEFPGGKLEPGETLAQCVKREIKEELDVTVKVGKKVAEVPHAYSHFKIVLHAFDCVYQSGRPKAIGCRAWKWVTPHELTTLAFPAANQPIIAQLLGAIRLPKSQNARAAVSSR